MRPAMAEPTLWAQLVKEYAGKPVSTAPRGLHANLSVQVGQ